MQQLLLRQTERYAFDAARDPTLLALKEALQDPSQDCFSLHLIDQCQQLQQRGPLHLERLLLQSFSHTEFESLGLLAYFPRLYRGLPRLHHRENPLLVRMRPAFTDLRRLKMLALDRALFSLYRQERFIHRAKVVLLTWVMSDGWGDFTAALEVAHLLSEAGVQDISLFILAASEIPFSWKIPERCRYEWICISSQGVAEPFSTQQLQLCAEADLILQIPTYWPYLPQLLQSLTPFGLFPCVEHLGEYGFLESPFCHPKTGHRSMGLHGLEKGILIRPQEPHLVSSLKQSLPPTFYLAYLSTPSGGAAYLHALALWLEKEEETIHVCVPDIRWLLAYIQRQEALGKPFLEKPYGIRAVHIVWKGTSHCIPLARDGKLLSFFCTDSLAIDDFKVLLQLSAPWIGVRGNQSFSEVLATGKPFFYDARPHSRHFLKDLLAIVEQRMGSATLLRALLRSLWHLFLLQSPVSQDTEWVESSYFERDPSTSWLELAEQLGLCLRSPALRLEFQQLSSLLTAELSCNQFLIDLVGRSVCHRRHCAIADLERGEIESYLSNNQSLTDLFCTLSSAMGKSYCNSQRKQLSSKTLLD